MDLKWWVGTSTKVNHSRTFSMQVPTSTFLLLELQVSMGTIWYHLVSPNENVAGSELVM